MRERPVAGLDIYRPFARTGARRESSKGLDVSAFRAWSASHRAIAGPFWGEGSGRLNVAEAFYRDAIAAIRNRALTVPNPFGGGSVATRDVLVSPSHDWTSVPMFAFRFGGGEPFYFLKRGHSWCNDIGILLPERQLLVSFQQDERWLAKDAADIDRLFAFAEPYRSRPRHASSRRPCVIVNSDHFAHHIWNELSVVEGLVAEGLHDEVQLLVNRRPLGALAELFPEISKRSIVDLSGPPDEPFRFALERSLFVAPAGRRFIPRRLIDRLVAFARRTCPDDCARADAFRAGHAFVLWIAIRLDARTATNLSEAMAAAITAVLRRHPRAGVVFDGFTGPVAGTFDVDPALVDRERRAVEEIVRLVARPFDHVMLTGASTLAAFLWARTTDFYITPYGTAQHKIAWINPVPGLVHVGENKRPLAPVAGAYHPLQRGELPAFFFGNVVRADGASGDQRSDLFSYELDVEKFAAAVDREVADRCGDEDRRGPSI